MHCALRFRKLGREWFCGKPLHLSLMFRSAVRALKMHHIGPHAGKGGVVLAVRGVSELVGLLDGMGNDRALVLFPIPRAFRAQPASDRVEPSQRLRNLRRVVAHRRYFFVVEVAVVDVCGAAWPVEPVAPVAPVAPLGAGVVVDVVFGAL